MNINRQLHRFVQIAVPYYGILSFPPLGLARIYFVVKVDPATRTAVNIELKVWNPRQVPNLSIWLRELGIAGVICSDCGSQYQIALNNENIWVLWRQQGEVEEVVERWARGEIGPGTSVEITTSLT
jgi:predicted Fe-Mo cluster-binding NifX family protein